MNEAQEKIEFAKLLLQEREPFKAALRLFPNNTNRAAFVARNWIYDKSVIAEQQRLKSSEDEMSELISLPTKTEVALEVLERARSCRSPEDSHRFYKLFADMNGMIEKPSTVVNNTNNNNPVVKVIEVPHFGTNEQWEAETERQQTELLRVSRSKH